MINLELYKVFYTVAKCKSITKAANELCLSQPAVSQAIKQLENQLGGKLFNRVSRGMELTEKGGKQVFECVSKAIELLETAEDKFKKLNGDNGGHLKISAPDTIISHVLMPYIKEFHALKPLVTISFINGTTQKTLDFIKDKKADIGFVNLPIFDLDVTLVGQIGSLNDVFVASDKYSELKGKEIEFSSLSNYPLIMLEQKTSTRQEFINFTRSLNVELTPEFELASWKLCVEMAKGGLGIACVPREYIKDELEKGQLFELNVTPKIPTRSIGVILNSEREVAGELAEFLKIIKKLNNV